MKTKSDKFKNIFKIYEFKNRHIVFNIFGIKIKFIIDKKYKKYRSLPSIKYLEVHLCDHCNLKCKLCSHYCNLVQSEIFTDLKQYKKDINELAKKLNIKTIRLMGGEPLLNPDIEEFFKATREAFCYSNIRLVTNGILLPNMKESFWQSCRENKITIDLSKYPIVGDKFSRYLDLIDDNNVNLGGIHLSRKFHTIENPKGNSDIEKAFKNCYSKHCANLWHQRIWVCPACYRTYSNQILNENKDLPPSVDIYKANAQDIINIIEKPNYACRWCPEEIEKIPWNKIENINSEETENV